jgi:hypothetical protein
MMRQSRIVATTLTLATVVLFVRQAEAAQVGVWQFNNDLNNSVSGGSPMSIFGGWASNFANDTIGGSSATVLSFPAMASGTQSLQMPNQAGANGGGLETNDWTIVMDVKFPSITGFISLWQTDQNIGASDGEFFVRGDGAIGIGGQYHGTVQANNWHRIAVSLTKNPSDTQVKLDKYIDGALVGTSLSGAYPDGRHAVKAVLNLFGDEDGETAAGMLNSLAYYNSALSANQIGALGGPTAAGIGVIPEPSSLLLAAYAMGLLAVVRRARQ